MTAYLFLNCQNSKAWRVKGACDTSISFAVLMEQAWLINLSSLLRFSVRFKCPRAVGCLSILPYSTFLSSLPLSLRRLPARRWNIIDIFVIAQGRVTSAVTLRFLASCNPNSLEPAEDRTKRKIFKMPWDLPVGENVPSLLPQTNKDEGCSYYSISLRAADSCLLQAFYITEQHWSPLGTVSATIFSHQAQGNMFWVCRFHFLPSAFLPLVSIFGSFIHFYLIFHQPPAPTPHSNSYITCSLPYAH